MFKKIIKKNNRFLLIFLTLKDMLKMSNLICTIKKTFWLKYKLRKKIQKGYISKKNSK